MSYTSLCVVMTDWGTYATKYFPALGSPLVLYTRRTTPVSDFKAVAHLLPLDEFVRLWEPQKWILKHDFFRSDTRF